MDNRNRNGKVLLLESRGGEIQIVRWKLVYLDNLTRLLQNCDHERFQSTWSSFNQRVRKGKIPIGTNDENIWVDAEVFPVTAAHI
jgi:hypothetical protein